MDPTSSWVGFCSSYGDLVTRLQVDSCLSSGAIEFLLSVVNNSAREEARICPNLKAIAIDMRVTKQTQDLQAIFKLLALLLGSGLGTVEIKEHRGDVDIHWVLGIIRNSCPLVSNITIRQATGDPEELDRLPYFHDLDCSIFSNTLSSVSLQDLSWEGWQKLAFCDALTKITVKDSWRTKIGPDKVGSSIEAPMLAFPSLRDLTLYEDAICRRVVLHSHMPLLETLSMRSLWDVEGDAVSILCRRSPLLREITIALDCHYFTTHAITPFANLTNLKSLGIGGIAECIQLSDAAITHLAQSLTGLQHLDLWIHFTSDNWTPGTPQSVYPTGLSLLALAQHCRELKSLSLPAVISNVELESAISIANESLRNLFIPLTKSAPAADLQKLGRNLASLFPCMKAHSVLFRKLHGQPPLGNEGEQEVRAGFTSNKVNEVEDREG